MNKVTVELEYAEKKRYQLNSTNRSNNACTPPQYEGWITSDYTGEQLRRDVARFWQLDANKYELLDGVASIVVPDETPLDPLAATTFTLRKRRGAMTRDHEGLETQQSRNDPFWLQEKLFDVFLIHALPHWKGKGSIVVSCYQFKQLILKATSQSSSKTLKSTKRPPHEFAVRVLLAFKTATPNYSGAGATFHEFLDALMDVATFMYPRLSAGSKEHALEQLTQKYLIPYYDRLEQDTVHRIFSSWSTIDELVLLRPKVKQLLNRFAQPLFEIALAYTTSVSGPRRQRGLQFQEFSRLVHDVKPSSVPLNSLELCFCFIHCCRIELSHGFTTASAAIFVAKESPGCLASLNAGSDGSGRGVLEISCANLVHVIAYLALLSMPGLALSKPSTSRDNQSQQLSRAVLPTKCIERVSSKIAVLSIKAFLHFMSLRLASTGRATATTVAAASPRFASMKKDTTLPLVSVNFLQEFLRMHREDALDDYLSSCGDALQQSFAAHDSVNVESREDDTGKQDQSQLSTKDTQRPEQEEDGPKPVDDVDDDGLGLDIDWGDESSEESEQTPPREQESSPTSAPESVDMTPEEALMRQEREREVLRSMMNDADEIYTFLVSELQRHHADERKLDDTEIVPQLLDIWVAAGQKYAQVINYLDSLIQDAGNATECLLDRKARVLERFGMSLYVFAIQLLKSTSKVFNYEELFHVTNVRVYNHVTSELWDSEQSATFTTDLATETLSLASGKLSAACKLLEECHQLVWARSRQTEQPLMQSVEEEEDEDESDEELDRESTLSCVRITERYVQCLLHRAYCLDVYGDVLGHTRRWSVDFDLGCALEEDHEKQLAATIGTRGGDTSLSETVPIFYSTNEVLSKTSSAGRFYREAKRIYRFLSAEIARLGWNDASDVLVLALTERLAKVEFKVASHLPRGCLAEKHLLDSAVQRLSTSDSHGLLDTEAKNRFTTTKAYISAIQALRTKFFQPETEKISFEGLDSDAIVPFYHFVLVAALREVDPTKTGLFTRSQLSRFNEICKCSAVSRSVMDWLMTNFDHGDTPEPGLTEKGIFQYFCWLAESDPLTFCSVLDLLTAKYTESPISISSGIASQTGREAKAKSLRATLFSHGRQRASASMLSSTGATLSKPNPMNGIADCIVIVAAKMTSESCCDISQTRSPSDVKLEPMIADVLPLRADVPEELSKFCFPDHPFLSSELLPPKTFDIVLTDITGARQYGSCLHFFEERDPIDILAMISGMQRGTKTASLPPWISLKDVQQRKAKMKFFIPKCVCILSRLPLYRTFRDCLATLYRLSLSSPPFPVESFLLNILEQVPVPSSPNAATSFTLVDKAQVLTVLPQSVPHLFPNEVDFTLLFQCLSAENILKVYSYLLTEKKLVLSSRNISILTPCAETLRALLYPFECQVVYIPVLPLALLDFVTAPVPFFMGVCSNESIERLTEEGVVVVNLDKDEVAEPATEALPTLPEVRAKKLLQTLRKTSSWAARQTSRQRFGRYQQGELSEITAFSKIEVSEIDVVQALQQQDDAQEKWTEIHVLFTTFVMRLLKDFRKYCHRAKNTEGREITIFDKKAFLAMHPSQREFCVHLFQTQHFQRFIDTSSSLSESVLQLAASDAEQSWRHVRSKSIMIRRGDTGDVENAKSPTRHITRAPPLARLSSSSAFERPSGPAHRRRPSGRHNGIEIIAPFNSHIYDELRGMGMESETQSHKDTAQLSAPPSRPTLPSHRSSGTLMSSPRSSLVGVPGGDASSSLIVAARLRLDIPIENSGQQ